MKNAVQISCPSLPGFDEYINEIRDIWNARYITNAGSKHTSLEKELESYFNVPNVTLFTNGHLALESILTAMDFPPGSEVITTPFTFASTTHAIVRCGLTPVFCDIRPGTYTLDASGIERLITPSTAAIVPVHVYGNLCDTDAIQRIADKHELKVIYDAAHTFGVTRGGVSSANFGDASIFSFHATKVFHTIEGGAVTYKDEKLTVRLNCLKNFGIKDSEHITHVGGNAKMNEFCAAMGICNLRHIDEEIAKRKIVFEAYGRLLTGISGLTLPSIQPDVVPNYAYYPILVDENAFGINRDELARRLAERDIFARKYFFPLTSAFDCYKGRFDPSKTPIALDISQKVLTLPMYAGLTEADVARICEAIGSARNE